LRYDGLACHVIRAHNDHQCSVRPEWIEQFCEMLILLADVGVPLARGMRKPHGATER